MQREIRAALDGAELLMGEKIRMREDLSPLTNFIAGCTKPILFFNIGSDRCTGDSYGPLLGTMLTEMGAKEFGVTIVGTLDIPVHAENLQRMIAAYKDKSEQRLWIATDSCLGSVESVGSITLSEGMLTPGTGVNKMLPPVGDYALQGIVNASSGAGRLAQYLGLQGTRLDAVYYLAKSSAVAIIKGLEKRAQSVPALTLRTTT